MKITREHAVKVIELLSHGLVSGLGEQVPGKMCVEAVWCAAMGLPHGDNPPCVGSAVRAYKIRLNDSSWSDNMARANGMRALAIAQAGSDQIDQTAFRKEVIFQGIRQILPIALRAAASMFPAHKDALETVAIGCEIATDFTTARAAARAAREVTLPIRYAADAYAAAAAYAAAYAYADAAYAAAYAADAAYAAAYAYADAAAAAYAADAAAARGKIRDKVLSIAASIGVAALKKLGSPGCQWLDLVGE